MTLQSFLASRSETLMTQGVATARLDVLILLEDLLGTDRANLLAHPEIKLTDQQTQILDEQIKRRARHIPLAYLRGKTEFYGREFIVSPDVLEPRPESEVIIDMLKQLPLGDNMTIVDIGTGSGALAITAKLEMPDVRVTAIDIDPRCLAITRKNCQKHHAEVSVLQGDLLEPFTATLGESYALLCNLPYVPDNFQINIAASHEPRLAIFGGPDGLDVYRNLFSQLTSRDHKPRFVLTESLPPQHQQLADIATRHGFRLSSAQDFVQLFVPAK